MAAPSISCRGKVGFVTFLLAAAAADRARRNRDGRSHAYRCSYCAHYHVGGSVPAKHFKRPRPTEKWIDE